MILPQELSKSEELISRIIENNNQPINLLFLTKEFHRDCDHKFMKRLIASYREAIGVIEFYGDTENWYKEKKSFNRFDIISPEDVPDIDSAPKVFGGTKARTFLAKAGE